VWKSVCLIQVVKIYIYSETSISSMFSQLFHKRLFDSGNIQFWVVINDVTVIWFQYTTIIESMTVSSPSPKIQKCLGTFNDSISPLLGTSSDSSYIFLIYSSYI